MESSKRYNKIIKPQKVSSQVYENLLEMIKNEEWTAGSKLPSENELRLQMGVSRISIREAMQKLTALGIVETRQGEGSFVRGINSDNYSEFLFPMFMINKNTIQELMEYRMVMDIGAIQIAAGKVSTEQLRKLEEIVVRMENNDSDAESFARDDLNFHMAIARATDNKMIINVALYMMELMSESMKSIVSNLGMNDGKHFHRLILDKLKSGDRDGAVEAMRQHVTKTVSRLSELEDI